MASYYREQGFHGRTRLLRRLRVVWALLLIALVVGGVYVGYDIYKQMQESEQPSNPSTAVTSIVEANKQLQTSPYFQFETPKNWKVIANESRADHFVYRQFNSTLIQQELTVDINRDPTPALSLVQITHVLPVQIANGRELRPGVTSDHCKNALKSNPTRNQIMVTYQKVTFACNPDTTNYVAVVGLEGGNTALPLTRRDGSKVTYYLTYKNLSAQPSDGDLEGMVRTFEAK